MKTTELPKVLGYIRVSTMEQWTQGVSLGTQRGWIEDYCRLMSLDLVDVVTDEGVSASIPLEKRPGGQELLIRLAPRMGVVASKLDRIFRDCIDALTIVGSWNDRSITLHLCDLGGAPINTKSSTGRLFLTFLAGFAELERNQIGERTRAALNHKKRSGQVYSGIPFGFRRRAGKLVPYELEQKTVTLIKRLRRRSNSLAAIADELNRRGIKTKRNAQWHPSTVRYILENDLHSKGAKK